MRKSKYVFMAVTGIVFVTIGLIISFYTSYYVSPHQLNEESFNLSLEGERSVILQLPGATSERVFYFLNFSSTGLLNATIKFMRDNSTVGLLNAGTGTRLLKEGSLLLSEAPEKALLILQCVSCEVNGVVSVRYFSVDYDRLLMLDIATLVLSLAGLISLMYGSYALIYHIRSSPQRSLERDFKP
ncbi:MAG: hypothetical protein QW291_06590 [Thermofilaceae archaeon]